MFSFSKHEIMRKIAMSATNSLKNDGKVVIDGFGTLTYDRDTDTYKFYPDTQLEQALRRTGQ